MVLKLTATTQITIQALKVEVERVWLMLHKSTMAEPQPESFKPEVRRLFGDLRFKHTWERAYAHFFVQWVIACVGDGDLFFKIMNPATWPVWRQELRLLMFDGLLADKRGISLVRGAYSYLVDMGKTELADGLLELAREFGARNRTASILEEARVS